MLMSVFIKRCSYKLLLNLAMVYRVRMMCCALIVFGFENNAETIVFIE